MRNAISKSICYLLFFFLSPCLTFAAAGEKGVDTSSNTAQTTTTYPQQSSGEPEMADLLRSNGMIYVVIGVILIVLTGLIIYLVSLDRKIGKLEKEVKEKEVRSEK